MADCPICGGTGFKIVVRGGVSGAGPCECRVPALAKAVADRSGIPKVYAGCEIESFRTSHALGDSILFVGFANAVLACAEYSAARNADPPGMMFYGPSGTGKTHLAVGILRKALARGYAGVFLDCGNMLEQVKATFGTNAKAEAYRAAMEAPIVLLDDLGAQQGSEWVKDTISSVVTHRYNEGKATLVTTRLGTEDLLERVGERTVSRLRGMCRLVQLPLGAEDYRKMNPGKRKRGT